MFCYHCSEIGIVIKFLDIICGEVHINVNEELLERKKRSPGIVTIADELDQFDVAKDMRKKQHALASVTKYTSMFPEKVSILVISIFSRLLFYFIKKTRLLAEFAHF